MKLVPVFEEAPLEKIRYTRGGWRKNSGRVASGHPSQKTFFMLSREMNDRLHTLTDRTMSKFVIDVLEKWDWTKKIKINLDPFDRPVAFHVRLPEALAFKVDGLPGGERNKSHFLDDRLKEEFTLEDEAAQSIEFT